jgi:hypothetical protein
MNSSSSQLNNPIQVAANGDRTWQQSSITTPQALGSSYSLTGIIKASQSEWDVAVFSFDSPFPCQSIALYFNHVTDVNTANGLSINDISFEYRTIHKRVS